jgi:hypothetical protein
MKENHRNPLTHNPQPSPSIPHNSPQKPKRTKDKLWLRSSRLQHHDFNQLQHPVNNFTSSAGHHPQHLCRLRLTSYAGICLMTFAACAFCHGRKTQTCGPEVVQEHRNRPTLRHFEPGASATLRRVPCYCWLAPWCWLVPCWCSVPWCWSVP